MSDTDSAMRVIRQDSRHGGVRGVRNGSYSGKQYLTKPHWDRQHS